jgi:hypothetical protein
MIELKISTFPIESEVNYAIYHIPVFVSAPSYWRTGCYQSFPKMEMGLWPVREETVMFVRISLPYEMYGRKYIQEQLVGPFSDTESAKAWHKSFSELMADRGFSGKIDLVPKTNRHEAILSSSEESPEGVYDKMYKLLYMLCTG